MNCLPAARSLKRFGRILRKMLPSSSRLPVFRAMRRSDSRDISPDNSYFSLSPSPSQSYISFDDLASEISEIWMGPKHVDSSSGCSMTSPFSSPATSPAKSAASSPASSGYDSWWTKPASKLPSLAESFSSNLIEPIWCGSFLPPISSKGPRSDDSTYSSLSIDSLQSFSYSPLSTFKPNDSTPSASSLIRFNVNELSLSSSSVPVPDIDEILQDFEQNGLTMEVHEEFSPPKSSTPVTDRRSFQGREENPFNQQPVFYPKAPLKPPRWQTRPKMKVKPNKKALLDHCAFCKNNGRSIADYSSHITKDADGRVVCPKLYKYVCPRCNESGDKAHTLKYCPQKPIVTAEDVARMDLEDKIRC